MGTQPPRPMAEDPRAIELSRAIPTDRSTALGRTNSSVSIPEHEHTKPPAAPKSFSDRPVFASVHAPCMEVPNSRKHELDSAGSNSEDNIPEEDRRVTVWNPITGKKLSGNASPFRRNLHKYLAAHPDWEECPDAGDTKKRRKTCSNNSNQLLAKRSKLEEYDIGGCPLYLWDCLVAVAHAHSQNEDEWQGPIENIPSPRTPITIPCRFTLSTAG